MAEPFKIKILGELVGTSAGYEYFGDDVHVFYGVTISNNVFAEAVPDGVNLSINLIDGEFAAFDDDASPEQPLTYKG